MNLTEIKNSENPARELAELLRTLHREGKHLQLYFYNLFSIALPTDLPRMIDFMELPVQTKPYWSFQGLSIWTTSLYGQKKTTQVMRRLLS
jgi:hypothetical protein